MEWKKKKKKNNRKILLKLGTAFYKPHNIYFLCKLTQPINADKLRFQNLNGYILATVCSTVTDKETVYDPDDWNEKYHSI